MLTVDGKNIDNDTLTILMQKILAENHNLRILSLNNNMIGDRGALYLSNMISNLNSLEILYLSTFPLTDLENNNIQDKGGLRLCEGILSNNSLQLLNLRKISSNR